MDLESNVYLFTNIKSKRILKLMNQLEKIGIKNAEWPARNILRETTPQAITLGYL